MSSTKNERVIKAQVVNTCEQVTSEVVRVDFPKGNGIKYDCYSTTIEPHATRVIRIPYNEVYFYSVTVGDDMGQLMHYIYKPSNSKEFCSMTQILISNMMDSVREVTVHWMMM